MYNSDCVACIVFTLSEYVVPHYAGAQYLWRHCEPSMAYTSEYISSLLNMDGDLRFVVSQDEGKV